MAGPNDRFIRSVSLPPERVPDPGAYPLSIPAVRALAAGALELDPGVTFLVGENGSGKSTLIEAIAVAAGFNPEGGTTGMRCSTRESHSALHDAMSLVRGSRRPRSGFFLRAESFSPQQQRLHEDGRGEGDQAHRDKGRLDHPYGRLRLIKSWAP